MAWTRPTAAEFWRAVEVYLATAYAAKPPPAAVVQRLDLVRAAANEDEFYAGKSFERDASTPPAKYSIRLGNPSYPHMKMIIEPAPDGVGHLFRVDTHDAHCLPPPTSKEYAMVCALIEANGKMAAAIENAWRAADVPTFRGFLQADLARRAAAAKA
jgi:hypothetical protein